jgi:ribosomal protein S18 acetylase RimI-like enzyme
VKQKKIMSLRIYKPESDALIVYQLAKQLFAYSEHFASESIDNFLNEYSGWVIVDRDNQIVAFLMYSLENMGDDQTGLYINFIGSLRPGCGQRLLSTFCAFTDEQHADSFLHVDRDGPAANRLIAWYQRNGFRLSAVHIVSPLVTAEEAAATVTLVRSSS